MSMKFSSGDCGLLRYVWEEVGLPYGLMGLQGSEQKNGEYRSDLSQYGCTNG